MALMTQVGLEFIARNRANRQINSFSRSVQRMGRQMLAIAGIGGGLYAVKRGFETIIKAAMGQEKAERALIAATGENIVEFKKYAAEIQSLTIYGDELILSQMAYAKNLGVTTDKLKDATKAAVGLAARFRIDLASAMMLVGRASMGQTQMLTRYGIIINQTLSAQEKFDELLRIGADSFHLAEEAAKDAAGTWEQFQNTLGDVAEDIGGPLLTVLTKGTRALLEYRKETDRLVEEWKILREEMEKPIVEKWIDIQVQESPLIKAAEEFARIEKQMLKDSVNAWQEYYHKRGTFEEQAQAAKEVDAEADRLRTEIWLKEEEAAYHAMRAPIIKLEKEQTEAWERSRRIHEDIARGMAGEFSNTIDSMIFEGKRFVDAMTDMLRSVLRMIIQIMTYEMIAKPLAYGIMGRPVPEAQAGGYVERGGLAKIHTGETIIPKNQVGGGDTHVHIHNEQGEDREISRVDQYIISDQRIIDVFTRRAQTDGPLRRSIKQATR